MHPVFLPAAPLFFTLTTFLMATTPAHAENDELLAQLEFTAVEYLIYTDQLQKLEATPCGGSTTSRHNVTLARKELLQAIPAELRPRLEQRLDSPLMQKLLEENSQGIASVLGAPGLAGIADQLSAEQRQACLEYTLVFEQNLEATRQDLDALLTGAREQ